MTNDRHHEQALELQLDALLHEAAGVLPSPSLADRIADAVRARRSVTPARAHSPWLFAAALLLGIGTIGAVTWLRNAERAAIVPLQDPQPAPQPTPTPTPAPAPTPAPKPQDPAPAPQDPAPKPAPQEAKKVKWTTLIADYSDNLVTEVDESGRTTLHLNEIFGAWDVESLDTGNLLVTEFSVSRVREIRRDGTDRLGL
jgi:outer membrane biosynthesis protein TonB